MSDDNPSTQSCTLRVRALARGREVWRQVSNPLALGLLGLAVAVALWGYGYKLSLYSPPEGPGSRVPAKLWIEHRFGFDRFSSSAAAPNLKARIYAQPGVSALVAAAPELPLRSVSSLFLRTARPRAIPFFHSAIPLRSPPLAISL